MKKFIFDFSLSTGAAEMKEANCPLVIPAVQGRHECDFDVDHSSLTEAESQSMYRRAQYMAEQKGEGPGSDELPIGFNLATLPDGTVIQVKDALDA